MNNEIGIAATNFNATKTNIVAFPSLGATIPSSTPAPSQAAVNQNPSSTKPAYAASSGFQNSATSHNAAPGLPPAFELAQLSVVGATMLLMMTGSGLFFLF